MTRREIPEPTTQLPPKIEDRPLCGIDEGAAGRIIGWYVLIAMIMFGIYVAQMLNFIPPMGGVSR